MVDFLRTPECQSGAETDSETGIGVRDTYSSVQHALGSRPPMHSLFRPLQWRRTKRRRMVPLDRV